MGCGGGGIHCTGSDSSPTIANNLIHDNTAPWEGGGFLAYSSSTPILINNTITQNYCTVSSSAGAGVCSYGDAHIAGYNNIVYDNEANSDPDCLTGYGGTMQLNYTCSGDMLSGTGNITDDPMFLNPQNDDFNLQAGSPCIDTGNPSGSLDPDGTIGDMGALYFDQGGVTPQNVTIDLTYVSGSPVSAGGGNLTFDVFVENLEASAVNFEAWLETVFEGGDPTTLIARTFVDYQPGWTINRPDMWYPIPGAWAAGNYTFGGKVGINPSSVWDESSFPFIKSGTSDGSAFQPFQVDGAPNPFDRLDKDNEATMMAFDYMLIKAHPNPVNPVTTVSYDLPESGLTQITVFNAAGQQVANLVDGYRLEGMHSVTWDASAQPSGMYFIKLSTKSQSEVQKVLLLK